MSRWSGLVGGVPWVMREGQVVREVRFEGGSQGGGVSYDEGVKRMRRARQRWRRKHALECERRG